MVREEERARGVAGSGGPIYQGAKIDFGGPMLNDTLAADERKEVLVVCRLVGGRQRRWAGVIAYSS